MQRKTALAVIREQQHQIDHDIAVAQADKWRSDLIAGLQIFKFSLTIQQLTETMMDASRSGAVHGGERPGTASTRAMNSQSFPRTTIVPAYQRVSPPSRKAFGNLKGYALNPVAGVNRIWNIIHVVERHPASDWKVLPVHPVLEEEMLMEGMSIANQLDAGVLKESSKDNGPVDAWEIFGDLLGKWIPGPVTTFLDSSGEQVAGDSTILGADSRELMRSRLNQLFEQFAQKRRNQMTASSGPH